MGEKRAWLGLSVFQGIGARRFKLLYDFFGSAKKIWEGSADQLRATGLPVNIVNEFLRFRSRFNPQGYAAWLKRKEIKWLTLKDKDYPKNLKEIDDPPFLLYYKGTITQADNRAMGVVGTRGATIYGREVTEGLVADLVVCGLTIVSGMARGIDSLAHKTAIEHGGRTMAIFGCGVDVIYPPENSSLAAEIIKNGAIVSEYPAGTKPSLGSFPYRNRIISGISLGVLVIEGAERSGSLITARKAAEQGREVFAVPGPITSRMSGATSKLLKDGAKIVRHVGDILEELNLKPQPVKKRAQEGKSKEEKAVLDALQDGALHIDKIARQMNMKIAHVASLLTIMEIQGKVKNLGGMVYGRKR